MSNPATQFRLKLPPQDLEVLSFSPTQPKKIKDWVDSLPKLKVGECAKRLYTAIQEMNRLKVDAALRFQMLEVMRDPIHFVCRSLEKHFLNQSVALPEKEARVAGLAQALQNHLAVGYKAVVITSLPATSASVDSNSLLSRALHRALSEANQVLVRSLQLYFPAPSGFWIELHTLYLLAENYGLLEHAALDPEDDSAESSIQDLYIRALLLTTAKPNQLRQQQIMRVYELASRWSRFAKITKSDPADGLFAIDMKRDYPPLYQSLLRKMSAPENIYYFDASEISNNLRELLLLPQGEPHPVARFFVPEKLPNDLTRILIQAWGVLSERAFTRIEENGSIELSLGLSATHYFASGKTDFNQMITGKQLADDPELNNPFLRRGPTGRRQDDYSGGDVWGLNVDGTMVGTSTSNLEKAIKQQSASVKAGEKDRYPRYYCDIINTSPGGYCVAWSRDVPPQVKTGEIIGVLEPDQEAWAIGVIRWVKQFKNAGVRMGLELIAPKAVACGCQAIHKKGGATEYMRSLLLPELRAIGQPATLITPNIAFSVGLKANLNEDGIVSKVQLSKQVASTASFCQFEFRVLVAGDGATDVSLADDKKPEIDSPDDDFDSVWSSL